MRPGTIRGVWWSLSYLHHDMVRINCNRRVLQKSLNLFLAPHITFESLALFVEDRLRVCGYDQMIYHPGRELVRKIVCENVYRVSWRECCFRYTHQIVLCRVSWADVFQSCRQPETNEKIDKLLSSYSGSLSNFSWQIHRRAS